MVRATKIIIYIIYIIKVVLTQLIASKCHFLIHGNKLSFSSSGLLFYYQSLKFKSIHISLCKKCLFLAQELTFLILHTQFSKYHTSNYLFTLHLIKISIFSVPFFNCFLFFVHNNHHSHSFFIFKTRKEEIKKKKLNLK